MKKKKPFTSLPSFGGYCTGIAHIYGAPGTGARRVPFHIDNDTKEDDGPAMAKARGEHRRICLGKKS